MSLEEINKWLDNEYGVSYTRLEELHDFYFEKYCDLQQENQSLKKQLEDMTLCRDIASGHRKEVQDRETILLNQQKEFIEYLENMLDNENDIFSVVRVKDVLSKYKEIIGGKDE